MNGTEPNERMGTARQSWRRRARDRERERDERGRVDVVVVVVGSRRESFERGRGGGNQTRVLLECGINSFIFISARNRSERAAVVGNERTPSSASLARGFVFVVAGRRGYSLSTARARKSERKR